MSTWVAPGVNTIGTWGTARREPSHVIVSTVPDDDGPRRRLGDETKARIADLASGWDAPVAPVPSPPVADPPVRKKQQTLPPPPPGSNARIALEASILDSSKTPTPARTTPPTQPPPARTKSATLPPAPPRGKKTMPPPIPPARPKGMTGQVPIIASTLTTTKPDTTLVDPPDVPRGEFAAQSARKLGLAEQPPTTVQPQPVEVLLNETAQQIIRQDPSDAPGTSPFERGDPTTNDNASNRIALPQTSPNSKLRAAATLRRKRGIGGDVRYVFTVLFGVRRAKQEFADLEQKQLTRQTSRRRHLITLGRTAAVADGFDHPALTKAREKLGDVEEERAQHAGAVAAADQELARVKRDRETKIKAFTGNVAALTAELADLAKKQEPLEKEAGAIKKRAAELRSALARVDAQIAMEQSSLVSVRGNKIDPASVQAEIATLRADRKAVERDEPVIAGELDALDPRIAAIEAARGEAQKKHAEIEANETADQRRTEELLEAIGAKRKVVDRASADSETLRDKILFELGERLNVDRPAALTTLLSPIDEIDMDLGTTDRRLMELREIISSVDRWKLFRGWSVILLVLGAIGTFVAWLLYMLL